ncbi:MAG: GNAT family N-acetyltransferase [Alphaproteobacteria bacterium]|nr:GNAT family N-acetyltransferase [Alphaproteobacteria bacterium]
MSEIGVVDCCILDYIFVEFVGRYFLLERFGFKIRLIEENDLDFMLSLREMESTNKFLGTFCMLNHALQKKWFESVIVSDKVRYYIFEKKNTVDKNKMVWHKIGIIRTSEIDYINRSVCIGADIAESYRGNGYSKVMYDMLLSLAFDYYNMHRVWLYVMENNVVALNLYKKIGFQEEGRQRKAVFRDGRYYDYIMMGMLVEEYKQRSKLSV